MTVTNVGRCSICESAKAQVINAYLQAGRSPNWISERMREMGYPTKGDTIRKHLQRDLGGDASRANILEGAVDGSLPANPNTDFAVAIRGEANRLLASGKLHVSAAHGLQAQALIDRRIEKQADRALMVQLAGLLLGGSMEPPADLIEGEYKDVTPDPDANMKQAIRELTTSS